MAGSIDGRQEPSLLYSAPLWDIDVFQWLQVDVHPWPGPCALEWGRAPFAPRLPSRDWAWVCGDKQSTDTTDATDNAGGGV